MQTLVVEVVIVQKKVLHVIFWSQVLWSLAKFLSSEIAISMCFILQIQKKIITAVLLEYNRFITLTVLLG